MRKYLPPNLQLMVYLKKSLDNIFLEHSALFGSAEWFKRLPRCCFFYSFIHLYPGQGHGGCRAYHRYNGCEVGIDPG